MNTYGLKVMNDSGLRQRHATAPRSRNPTQLLLGMSRIVRLSFKQRIARRGRGRVLRLIPRNDPFSCHSLNY